MLGVLATREVEVEESKFEACWSRAKVAQDPTQKQTKGQKVGGVAQ
jgi:hypothetical protein